MGEFDCYRKRSFDSMDILRVSFFDRLNVFPPARLSCRLEADPRIGPSEVIRVPPEKEREQRQGFSTISSHLDSSFSSLNVFH